MQRCPRARSATPPVDVVVSTEPTNVLVSSGMFYTAMRANVCLPQPYAACAAGPCRIDYHERGGAGQRFLQFLQSLLDRTELTFGLNHPKPSAAVASRFCPVLCFGLWGR